MPTIQDFKTIRTYSETLCKPLKIEDYGVQIVSFASPAKWHLAHTTWFFEEFILKNHLKNYIEFNENYNYLFNSYYNNAGDRILRTNRGNLTRPRVEKIYNYRAYVDQKMLELLSDTSSKIVNELTILGLNHEQQHQELLLTDLKYMFGHHPLFPRYKKDFNLLNDTNPKTDFITIKEGVYEIGFQKEGFCYDNELGRHKVYLADFEISNKLVTNKEFISFIEDGGYQNFNLWLDDGWSWLQKNAVKSPMYWHKIANQWYYFTLGGLQKINLEAMVSHVSFYEAAAFAAWKKMRLPTEFEWEVASNQLSWGKRWEWTYSAYLPYPNFKKAKGAIGEYNGKFMINQMVLRGASVATAKNHSRESYRNFFYPDQRWQYTGIRLVK